MIGASTYLLFTALRPVFSNLYGTLYPETVPKIVDFLN